MKKLNKVLTIIMIILFPLGIVYCICKNLFSGNFASFLGGVLLFAGGFIVSVVLLRYDIIQSIGAFFGIS